MSARPPKTFFAGVILPTVYISIMMFILTGLFEIDTPFLRYVQSTGQQTTPTGSSTTGQIEFDVFFLSVSVISVFVLTTLMVRKKVKDKMFWFMGGFFLISQSILALLVFYWVLPLFVIFEIVGFWVLYMLSVTGKINKLFVLPFMTSYAIIAGMGLTLTLPPLTLAILPIAFSCWDLYAVFRGPMEKLATEMVKMPKLQYLFVVRIGQVTIGMGDLLFYSITAGFSLLFGLKAGCTSIGFMVGGIYLTFVLLRSGRFRVLPGLPIPIAAAMFGLVISVFIGI